MIVVAPPYGRGLQQKVLEALEEDSLLAPGGVLVVQRDAREPVALPSRASAFALEETRRYGRTVFDFYLRGE
ncbi:MAG: RsmD family RNA methyltransferase [Deltaproteobacteria bacterium]|nr:RsmD family RNA methyltransferase [Deltaproteobacteria bacterium]